jgi:sulfur-oxidizing protein SoxZ
MTTINARPRVRVQRTATAGEVVELKTLITHPMETGHRREADGTLVPRHIIERFTCEFNGVNVIDMRIHGGISANPYFEFWATVNESGTFTFAWHDQNGDIYTDSANIAVS